MTQKMTPVAESILRIASGIKERSSMVSHSDAAWFDDRYYYDYKISDLQELDQRVLQKIARSVDDDARVSFEQGSILRISISYADWGPLNGVWNRIRGGSPKERFPKTMDAICAAVEKLAV